MAHTARRSTLAPAFALPVMLVLGSLLAAGCSSDSEPTTSKPKRTTTTSAEVAKPTTTLPVVDLSKIEDPTAKFEAALGPVITTFTAEQGDDATEQIECLAPRWVKVITLDGFADAGASPEELQSKKVGLDDLDLSKAQADELAAGFASCDIDRRASVIAAIANDAGLTADARSCLEENLSDDFIDDTFVASVTGDDLEKSAFDDIRACLAD